METSEYEKTLKAENEILRFRLKEAEKENQQLRSLIDVQARKLRLIEEKPSISYPLSFCF
jgi:hypothetical protein